MKSMIKYMNGIYLLFSSAAILFLIPRYLIQDTPIEYKLGIFMGAVIMVALVCAPYFHAFNLETAVERARQCRDRRARQG